MKVSGGGCTYDAAGGTIQSRGNVVRGGIMLCHTKATDTLRSDGERQEEVFSSLLERAGAE